MRVELRPSAPDDFVALLGRSQQFRARAITATADGVVLGIGGLVYLPNGEVWASVMMREAARRYPHAVHRAGRMAMAMIRSSGVKRVFARAEDHPRAVRWLERLGFTAVPDSDRVFVWRADVPHDR